MPLDEAPELTGSSHEAGELKEDPITIAEITTIAQKKLPKQVWDYYASGADEERTLKRNANAFDR
jgi:(S)-2-hydroxy-acid oxidase